MDNEQKKTLVSIIMSVYNGSYSAENAIASIVEQSFTDWELLIVDDGSTDNTALILKKWAENDHRIKILTNSKNKGLAYSLNLAISKAKGKYFARMDHDDISHFDRLQKQTEFLEKFPDIHVLGTGIQMIDEKGMKTECRFRPEKHEDLVKKIFQENPFYHPTVMARREFFEIMEGYDEKFRRAQDYDLWLRGYRNFRYHNLQVPLLFYKRRTVTKAINIFYSVIVLVTALKREKRLFSNLFFIIRNPVAGILERISNPELYSFFQNIYRKFKKQ